MKSFYDFNTNNLWERQERNKKYPEMAKFHLALREEIGEEEYQQFYQSEKEAYKCYSMPMLNQNTPKWITV